MPTDCKFPGYLLQFPIPDELDVGLHDHLARDGFGGKYWNEMGKRWRALCRRLLEYVSHQAGGKLHWMKELAAQQAHEQTIEIHVETFSGRIITLPFDRFDLNRRRLSVHLIKKRIQQLEAIPFSQQQLMLNDKVLDDGELLDDYDKLEGSSLHLVVMRVNGSSQDDIISEIEAQRDQVAREVAKGVFDNLGRLTFALQDSR